MIYDLNKYRSNIKPIVKQRCDNYPKVTPIDNLNALTQSTYCPIIYVAYYIGELYGFTDEVIDIIKKLELYYEVEIINKEFL